MSRRALWEDLISKSACLARASPIFQMTASPSLWHTPKIAILLCARLSRGMHLLVVWIGGIWKGQFPESKMISSEAETYRKPLRIQIPRRERLTTYFRLRISKILNPKNASPKYLSVLKHSVPKMLVFAFGLHVRSKTQRFKRCILGEPKEEVTIRALHGETLALKSRHAIVSCNLDTALAARACVQVPMHSRNVAFCVCVVTT